MSVGGRGGAGSSNNNFEQQKFTQTVNSLDRPVKKNSGEAKLNETQ